MAWEKKELTVALEHALQQLATYSGEDLAELLKSIIFTNLNAGRVHTYLNNHPHYHPRDYVWLVADHHERWHTYVHKIQIEKQAELWELLFVKLQKWAYNYLRRKNVPAEAGRFEQALDYATEASIVLIAAHFPYDVDFDPWACVLLQNICRCHIRKTVNSASTLDKDLLTLEHCYQQLRALGDPSAKEAQHLAELRCDLLDAIEHLASEARKQFALLYYFEDNTLEQIAEKMNRQVNALYKLHFGSVLEK
jgi:RNA polymerase sigma factor (sigma-70 family)